MLSKMTLMKLEIQIDLIGFITSICRQILNSNINNIIITFFSFVDQNLGEIKLSVLDAIGDCLSIGLK